MLKCSDKHFTLEVSRQQKVISLDRLKPAHLDSYDYLTTSPHTKPLPPAPTPQPSYPTLISSAHVRITRSGRHVHWPDWLDL